MGPGRGHDQGATDWTQICRTPKLVTGSAIKFVVAAARVKVIPCLKKKKLSFKQRNHNKPPERSHKVG